MRAYSIAADGELALPTCCCRSRFQTFAHGEWQSRFEPWSLPGSHFHTFVFDDIIAREGAVEGRPVAVPFCGIFTSGGRTGGWCWMTGFGRSEPAGVELQISR